MSALESARRTGAAAPRRLGRLPLPVSWLQGLLGFMLVFAIAEWFTRLELVDPSYLPPASQILGAAVGLFEDGVFWSNVRATMEAWAVGLALAMAIAIPLGFALGSVRLLHRASELIIELLRPIPAVALIPLALLVFGQGLQMKVFLVTFACIWPILFNTLYGTHDVDPLAKDTARSYGVPWYRILLRVTLPSAAPFILTGVRIAGAIALVVVISAELFAGGNSGVGAWMLQLSLSAADTDRVYAAALITGVIGVIINSGLELTERLAFGWQAKYRRSA